MTYNQVAAAFDGDKGNGTPENINNEKIKHLYGIFIKKKLYVAFLMTNLK